jgi:putative acetyltransferase
VAEQAVPMNLRATPRSSPSAMAQPTTLSDRFVIRSERPDQPHVLALLEALDAYLGNLYAPQDNHILSVGELLSPEVYFLVARRDCRAIGCAASRRMPGEAATAGQAYGEIKRMMVEPSVRGQGVGAALLAGLEGRLLDDGLQLALLETGAAQVQAVSLYERCGYMRRAPFGGYPDNGLSLFFQKRLRA